MNTIVQDDFGGSKDGLGWNIRELLIFKKQRGNRESDREW